MERTIQIIQSKRKKTFSMHNFVDILRFNQTVQLAYRYKDRYDEWVNKVYFVDRSKLNYWVDTEGKSHTDFDTLADTLEAYTEQAKVMNALDNLK